MAIDLTKTIEEIKKTTTIGEIKRISVDGKEVFTKQERDLYFTNPLIVNNIEDAKKVATLLARIKKSDEELKKDDKLLSDLELERDANNLRGTVAHRVLNSEKLIIDKITALTFLSFVSDEDKTKREEKIKTLEKETGEKRLELANLEQSVKPLEEQLKSLVEDEEREKKRAQRMEDLATVISVKSTSTGEKLRYNGKLEDIGSIPNVTMNDYTNLITPIQDTKSVKDWIVHARDSLDQVKGKLHDDTNCGCFHFFQSKLPQNSFGNRVWKLKKSVTGESGSGVGYGLLRALRELGSDKLKKLVKNSGASASDQTKLEKYADEIVNCINWHEEIAGGEKGYNFFTSTDTGEDWDNKFERFHQTLTSKTKDQYPYVPAVDWEHVVEFMTAVFPLGTKDSNDRWEVKKDIKYLDDKSDANYIKPTTNDGWSYVTIGGFAESPPLGKTIDWYVEEGNASQLVKQQYDSGPTNFPSNGDFRWLVQTWYDVFDPFLDYTTKKWRTDAEDKITMEELQLKNLQHELRYINTMRELFFKLGLSSQIDEFDEYLIGIAGETEKQAWVDVDRKKSAEANAHGSDLSSVDSTSTAIQKYNKDFADGKVLKLDDEKDHAARFRRLQTSAQNKVSVANARVVGMTKQIGEIDEKKGGILFELNKKKNEIDMLKRLNDYKERPLPDKKSNFDELYNKKTNGKWTLEQILEMIKKLAMIKTDMDEIGEGDKFKSEKFEEKQTELITILNETKDITGDISNKWDRVLRGCGNSLSAAVKRILKEKDKTGVTLEEISNLFKKLEEKVNFEDWRQKEWDEVKKGISSPNDYKDTPQTPIVTDADLKEIFGDIGVATKELADKWGNAGVKKDEIKKIIEKVVDESDKKTPKSNFISHLKNGLDDGTKLTEENDSDKIWKEFLSKDPERVANTVHTHWIETKDNEDNTKKLMKEEKTGTGDDEKKLDMTKYGSTKEDGEPDKKGMVKYLWQKAKGSGLEYYKVGEEKEDEKKDEEGGKDKPFYSLDRASGKILWASVVVIVLIAIGAVIFWKSITDWWNGPADEQGENNKTEEGEKDEENE